MNYVHGNIRQSSQLDFAMSPLSKKGKLTVIFVLVLCVIDKIKLTKCKCASIDMCFIIKNRNYNISAVTSDVGSSE